MYNVLGHGPVGGRGPMSSRRGPVGEKGVLGGLGPIESHPKTQMANAHNLRVHTVSTREKGDGMAETFVQLRYDIFHGKEDPMMLALKNGDMFTGRMNLVLEDKAKYNEITAERDELKKQVGNMALEDNGAIGAIAAERDELKKKCTDLQFQIDSKEPTVEIVEIDESPLLQVATTVADDNNGTEVPFALSMPDKHNKLKSKHCCKHNCCTIN